MRNLLSIADQIMLQIPNKSVHHKPKHPLPLYNLRSSILAQWAKIDFYFIQRKKFFTESDRILDKQDIWTSHSESLRQSLRAFIDYSWHNLIKNKEFHDIMHVVLWFDINIAWEALLQSFHLGNKSPWDYTYTFLLANTLLLPDTLKQLKYAYELWGLFRNIREVDFMPLLDLPVIEVKKELLR